MPLPTIRITPADENVYTAEQVPAYEAAIIPETVPEPSAAHLHDRRTWFGQEESWMTDELAHRDLEQWHEWSNRQYSTSWQPSVRGKTWLLLVSGVLGTAAICVVLWYVADNKPLKANTTKVTRSLMDAAIASKVTDKFQGFLVYGNVALQTAAVRFAGNIAAAKNSLLSNISAAIMKRSYDYPLQIIMESLNNTTNGTISITPSDHLVEQKVLMRRAALAAYTTTTAHAMVMPPELAATLLVVTTPTPANASAAITSLDLSS